MPVTGRMISSFNQASWITAKINQRKKTQLNSEPYFCTYGCTWALSYFAFSPTRSLTRLQKCDIQHSLTPIKVFELMWTNADSPLGEHGASQLWLWSEVNSWDSSWLKASFLYSQTVAIFLLETRLPSQYQKAWKNLTSVCIFMLELFNSERCISP